MSPSIRKKWTFTLTAFMVVKNGIGQGDKVEGLAGEVLKKKTLTIRVDLHQGKANTEVYTCDLSLDYVRINADYRT